MISSLSGKAAAPASSIYSAAKFGFRGFAHGARADLRGTGVGVSVIMPGFVRDAGMFADSGVKLPPGIGTSSPEQVASAVISAIERDRGEVTVAPFGLRIGANIAAVAPDLAAAGQRLMGGAKVAARLSQSANPTNAPMAVEDLPRVDLMVPVEGIPLAPAWSCQPPRALSTSSQWAAR